MVPTTSEIKDFKYIYDKEGTVPLSTGGAVGPARRVQVSFASIENVFNALLLYTPM